MRKNRINNTVLKPNNVYRLNFYQKVLVVLFVINFFGIFLIIAANMISIVPIISTLMIITGILLCVISIPLEVGVSYVYMGKNKNWNLESLLNSEYFENFCFQKRLYTQSLYDSRQVNIPEVEITDQGFRLTSLPGIAEKILDSKNDLDDFFAQNGLDLCISNSYAGGDGWIYFIIQKNFRKEGIGHEKKPE